jgi:hypothetical protein
VNDKSIRSPGAKRMMFCYVSDTQARDFGLHETQVFHDAKSAMMTRPHAGPHSVGSLLQLDVTVAQVERLGDDAKAARQRADSIRMDFMRDAGLDEETALDLLWKLRTVQE